MSSISPISWGRTVEQTTASAAATQFSQTLDQQQHGGAASTSNSDGSQTVIERQIISAGDGSKMMVLTETTINADGTTTAPTVIGRYRIQENTGNNKMITNDEQNTTNLAQDKAGNSLTAKTTTGIKSTIGKEYEDNSVTNAFDPGTLFSEKI